MTNDLSFLNMAKNNQPKVESLRNKTAESSAFNYAEKLKSDTQSKLQEAR